MTLTFTSNIIFGVRNSVSLQNPVKRGRLFIKSFYISKYLRIEIQNITQVY